MEQEKREKKVKMIGRGWILLCGLPILFASIILFLWFITSREIKEYLNIQKIVPIIASVTILISVTAFFCRIYFLKRRRWASEILKILSKCSKIQWFLTIAGLAGIVSLFFPFTNYEWHTTPIKMIWDYSQGYGYELGFPFLLIFIISFAMIYSNFSKKSYIFDQIIFYIISLSVIAFSIFWVIPFCFKIDKQLAMVIYTVSIFAGGIFFAARNFMAGKFKNLSPIILMQTTFISYIILLVILFRDHLNKGAYYAIGTCAIYIAQMVWISFQKAEKMTFLKYLKLAVILIISWALTLFFLNTKEKQLLRAAFDGDVKQVRLLIEKGTNLNYSQVDGQTALMLAAENGNLDIVKALLDRGVANVNLQDRFGYTALIKAVEKKHIEIVKTLLEADSNVYISRYGYTALQAAAKTGNNDILNMLLKAEADTNTKVHSNALISAACNGHTQIVKTLLTTGTDVNSKTNYIGTALMAAARNGQSDVIKILIDAHADINAKTEYGNTALMIASENGKIDIVNMLLDAKADANLENKNGGTVLSEAVQNGRTEIVKALLTKGNINKKEISMALWNTVNNGNIEIIKSLIQAGADVNFKYGFAFSEFEEAHLETILMRALMRLSYEGDNLNIVKTLIDANANVNIQDSEGQTALMYASGQGDIESVRLLLDAKADVNLKDKGGRTALMEAVQWRKENGIVKALVDAGADVNVKVPYDKDDEIKQGTILMWAAFGCDNDIFKILLGAKPDLNIQNEEGFTALMAAVLNGRTKNVKALLEAGADVNLKNKKGQTALKIAIKENHTNSIKLLKQYGANTPKED